MKQQTSPSSSPLFSLDVIIIIIIIVVIIIIIIMVPYVG